mgnify:CR=1 FL=1
MSNFEYDKLYDELIELEKVVPKFVVVIKFIYTNVFTPLVISSKFGYTIFNCFIIQ